MPHCQCSQKENADLPDSSLSGDFDFFHSSTKSIPSIDQPGQGGSALIEYGKWT